MLNCGRHDVVLLVLHFSAQKLSLWDLYFGLQRQEMNSSRALPDLLLTFVFPPVFRLLHPGLFGLKNEVH